jgi:hypothetical protein
LTTVASPQDPRAVHEVIDPATQLTGLGNARCHLLIIGHVERDAWMVASNATQARGHDARTGLPEQIRDGRAQAAAATGSSPA